LQNSNFLKSKAIFNHTDLSVVVPNDVLLYELMADINIIKKEHGLL